MTVWGLASGRGFTAGAARGALAWREYPTYDAALTAVEAGDWLVVLRYERPGVRVA